MTHDGTPAGGDGTLRLGYLGSADAANRIMAAVRATVGEFAVDLSEAQIAEPFATLRGGEVDALVTRFRIAEPDLTTGPVLFTEERILAVGASHPLAGRDVLDSEDLPDHPVFERPGAFPPDGYHQPVPRRPASGPPIPPRPRAGAIRRGCAPPAPPAAGR